MCTMTISQSHTPAPELAALKRALARESGSSRRNMMTAIKGSGRQDVRPQTGFYEPLETIRCRQALQA